MVDFDLRKPKIHKAFGLKNDKGVSTILIDRNTVDDCIQHIEEANCDILIAGPVPPNPAELLVSMAADQLLKTLSERYDYIIIDSPPVGIVSDSVPIMSKVDICIYIIRANYSKRNYINNVNRLYHDNQLHNLCIIVNDANASGTEYGYGYGYGYGEVYGSEAREPWHKRLFKKNFKS